jgi:nitric oxide reductase NorQ protein
MKDLKQSTKQRFGSLDFDYPETALEVAIVTKESGVDGIRTGKIALINLRKSGLLHAVYHAYLDHR